MTHLDSIRRACEAGVKWVQLRIKDQPEEVVLKAAMEAKMICDSFGAKLTINDYPQVAREVNAFGLHLGKEDMPLLEARKIAGELVLGGTANTFEDVRMHAKNGAAYVGVGPLRFTTTKKKLSPVLGPEGYRDLVKNCKAEGIKIPILAIGGLRLDDIEPLLKTGVYGIALSSLIALAPDPKEVTEKIYEKLNEHNHGKPTHSR